MMFTVFIPEETITPRRSNRSPILTEEQYFNRDKDKLKPFKCPTCGDHELFKGGVYIGCFGCLNYFTEIEIINANKEMVI